MEHKLDKEKVCLNLDLSWTQDLSIMQTPDIPQSLGTGISSIANKHKYPSSGADRCISDIISSEDTEDTDTASEDSTCSSESDEEAGGSASGDLHDHLILNT